MDRVQNDPTPKPHVLADGIRNINVTLVPNVVTTQDLGSNQVLPYNGVQSEGLFVEVLDLQNGSPHTQFVNLKELTLYIGIYALSAYSKLYFSY